jgi:formiminotetrahydrofolate cyclodeaminase
MLGERSVRDWLDALAAQTATPGGGSSTALMGAMAAALVAMVCRLSLARGAAGERSERLQAALDRAEALRARLTELIGADMTAYEAVMHSYALPRGTPGEQELRSAAIQGALRRATLVPLECARASAEVLAVVAVVSEEGQLSALGESGVAAEAAQAALRSSALNVSINLGSIRERAFVHEQRAELERIEHSCRHMHGHIHALIARRLSQVPRDP